MQKEPEWAAYSRYLSPKTSDPTVTRDRMQNGDRVCSFPTNLAKRKARPKKDILTPEQVAQLIAYAKTDKDRGIYYAFPFLTGMRVSEQLGLLWQDIDLDNNTITICCVQERDGSTSDATKTEAGERSIPISTRIFGTTETQLYQIHTLNSGRPF